MARARERHGRGLRGPLVMPRHAGRPEWRTARERFDALALAAVREIDSRWQPHLGQVEYVVEDTPAVSPELAADGVPLAGVDRRGGGRGHRLVLFRRPIERRARDRTELEELLLALVIEQVAELLGIEPEEVDPRYRPD